jgi:hypothetical protein
LLCGLPLLIERGLGCRQVSEQCRVRRKGLTGPWHARRKVRVGTRLSA